MMDTRTAGTGTRRADGRAAGRDDAGEAWPDTRVMPVVMAASAVRAAGGEPAARTREWPAAGAPAAGRRDDAQPKRGRVVMYPIRQSAGAGLTPEDGIDTSEIPLTEVRQDGIRTDELPAVHIEPAPPSYRPELYMKNHEALDALRNPANAGIRIERFDPRHSVVEVDLRARTARSRRIGTRITPLEDYADRPCGAMSVMVESRRNGVPAAIGHNWLVQSDEADQGVVTQLAMGF